MPTELDRIEAELTKKKRKPCVFGKWVLAHSEAEQARINGWLDDSANSTNRLHQLLGTDDTSGVCYATLERHRKKGCPCYKGRAAC